MPLLIYTPAHGTASVVNNHDKIMRGHFGSEFRVQSLCEKHSLNGIIIETFG